MADPPPGWEPADQGPGAQPGSAAAGPAQGHGGWQQAGGHGYQGHAGGVQPTSQQEANSYAMGAHLSGLTMLVGIPSFVGPLIIWLIGRDKHPFIDQEGKEALNFHLSLLIYGFIAGVLFVPVAIFTLFIGVIPMILLFIALYLAAIVFSILGAVSANKGQGYRYPFNLRLIS